MLKRILKGILKFLEIILEIIIGAIFVWLMIIAVSGLMIFIYWLFIIL